MKLALLLVLAPFLLLLRGATGSPDDNPELAELFNQDQVARDENFLKNGEQIQGFDRMRRLRVLRLLEDGEVRTPLDHFHAAMVLQHGESPLDYKLAHDLCKKAVEMDPSQKGARWLMAASWDRYLRSIGKPQWYGTQFSIVDDKYYLMEADLAHVSDDERKAVGTRTIAQIKEFLKKQNKTEDATLDPPPKQESVWNPGMKVPKMPATAPTTKP